MRRPQAARTPPPWPLLGRLPFAVAAALTCGADASTFWSSCGRSLADPLGGPTGATFLEACSAAAVAEAAPEVEDTPLDATATHAVPQWCIDVAVRLELDAASNSTACAGCTEACALALLVLWVTGQVTDVVTCTHSVMQLLVLGNLLPVSPKWLQGLKLAALLHGRRGLCRRLRAAELRGLRLPPPRSLAAAPSGAGDDLGSVVLLLAVTPDMLPTYAPFIDIWRCYASWHGLSFVLDTDIGEVQRAVPRRPWNWMRWFAARRHLPRYSAVLVVEPDQFVVPECWADERWQLARTMLRGGSGLGVGDVVTRDFGPPMTLNNGVVLVRNSAVGRFFLDLLLEKAAWSGTIEADQGAFDETVLEVLGAEAADRGDEGYASRCLQDVIPSWRGQEVANYARCWWLEAERLAGGPFGARRSRAVHFVDPRVADVNHVVGARGLEPALLHHFAGRSKDWGRMLALFGLRPDETGNCSRVLQHSVDSAARKPCSPAAPAQIVCEPPVFVC
mmetsp:Transcript_112962/g.326340  ORF Transcript_112962/g.326340 Transcript_112962/m.326340 type:complete len:505 (+) Transcript_112962:111-1625(+)